MNIIDNKGVTLLAVVLTVIVAVILAGVTISSIRNGDSTISSTQEYENASTNLQARVEEEIDVLYNELQHQS